MDDAEADYLDAAAWEDEQQDRLDRLERNKQLKETPVSSPVEKLMALGNAVAVAKQIVETNKSYNLSENDLYEIISATARKTMQPGQTEAQAFSKLVEHSIDIRKAMMIVKSAPLQPTQVSGVDALRVISSTKAYEALMRMANAMRAANPEQHLSESQAFARVFADPANARLAEVAHVRPQAAANNSFSHPASRVSRQHADSSAGPD